jgi:ribosomal protein S27E
MTFGKPKLTSEKVRCLNCGESYPECEITLRHAGRTAEGDFWNSKCPECGVYDMMQEYLAEMSEEEFKAEQHEIFRMRRG